MKILRIRGTDERFSVGKILCLGRNYAEHAKEMHAEVTEKPIVFLKPASAVILNGEEIVRPGISKELHHEVELVVAIGKSGKDIPLKDAYSHVFGYAIGLDMTLRDVQSEAKKNGLPWSVAKGFDTSAPVSELIPAGEIEDPQNLEIRCRVNGTTRQQASTKKMIFTVDRIIEYCSSIFTLERGDLIFTGTPEGVGEVKPGDMIEAELVGFAKTLHRVRAS